MRAYDCMIETDFTRWGDAEPSLFSVLPCAGGTRTTHGKIDLNRSLCLKKPNEQTLRFHRAAEQGKLQVAQMLLDNGVDVNARGLIGETVLHSAAGDGQSEMVTFLLSLIEEVDARDEEGCTPLYWAARKHQTEVAKLLIEKGADPKAVATNGRTPLHGALEVAPPPSEKEKKSTKKATEPTESREDCEIASLLLESGADVNSRDKDGSTSLHAAASCGNLEMARLLLTQPKIKVEQKNKAGQTPLHLAAEHGSKEMIKALLAAGAAVNGLDAANRTPLHYHLGARQRRKEVVDLLLSEGANVNAVDKEGRSPLHEATRSNPRDPLAELLRKHGAKDAT